jgi:hypothetical protein
MLTVLLVRARLVGSGGARIFSDKSSGISSLRWFRSRFCPVTFLRSPFPTIDEAFSNWATCPPTPRLERIGRPVSWAVPIGNE